MRTLKVAGWLVAMVLAWAVTAPCQISGKTVRKHRVVEENPIATAENAIDKKDYATAEKILQDAVVKDPEDYRAWFDLAFVLNATGRTPEAIDAYKKSVAAKPDVFESNLNLGLLLAKAGDPDAEKYLRAATQLKPSAHPQEGQARAWLSLAHVLQKSNPQEAVEAFKKAAALTPKDPEPHLSAALLLEKMKQYADAEAQYKAAAELNPKSSEALAGLVNIYMETGRLADAENSLRNYLKLDPNNGTAHVQLGRVLAALGKADEATAELRTGLQLAPGDPIVARELAELLINVKKPGEAETLIRSLLQQKPNDAELHRELGRTLIRQGKVKEAESEFYTAVKLKPDFGEAYGDLAIAANENKNYVLALQALNVRSKLLDENPGTYFLRATVYDHLNDKKQAAVFYHKFLEVAGGKFPDQEWQARHRLIAIEPKK